MDQKTRLLILNPSSIKKRGSYPEPPRANSGLATPEVSGREREIFQKGAIAMAEQFHGFDASILDERASRVGPAGIDISYQRLGKSDAPAVLLIMGIAAQSIHWPDSFCNALVDSGLQVIRFDNRDSGLSTHRNDAPSPRQWHTSHLFECIGAR